MLGLYTTSAKYINKNTINGNASLVINAGENLTTSSSASLPTGVDDPTKCNKIKCPIDNAKIIIDRK
jgi:hypothetical protein